MAPPCQQGQPTFQAARASLVADTISASPGWHKAAAGPAGVVSSVSVLLASMLSRRRAISPRAARTYICKTGFVIDLVDMFI